MPFKPGAEWNGNAKGRPRGEGLMLTSLLKAELEKVPEGEKKTYKELFIKKLLYKATVEGDERSLRLIINYVDGLPRQTIDFDLNTPAPLLVQFINGKDNPNPS